MKIAKRNIDVRVIRLNTPIPKLRVRNKKELEMQFMIYEN
jgi:hypothetical protein